MDIYLSVNNREQVICLPVLPSEFTVSKPHSNEVFETVTQGELNLIGKSKLKSISWSSFFPSKDYAFLRDKSYTAFGYVYMLDTWYSQKLPMRLIITETPINMACTIEDFSYTIKKDGDMYYSITLSEVILVQ
ncbi:MAG: hypothetical protein K5768_08745 [Firmicutes bacterium]|nr:hypothetical protein [Bacillota bacterium]